MEKTISIRNTEITFSIWDLGGQREFVNMLPLVCNDAVAILFMFDLTRKSTLNSIKEWYRQGRGFNKTAIPFLIGTKYDHFVNFPREDQEEISLQVCRSKLKKAHFCRHLILTKGFKQAKRYAKAMRASLIFSSTSHSINVQKVWTYFTCDITQLTNLTRFSKSSLAKPLTSNALFPRLKISANRFYCTNLYSRPLGDSHQYRNGLMMYVERCHALMINLSTTISPLRHKIFHNISCSMHRNNPQAT